MARTTYRMYQLSFVEHPAPGGPSFTERVCALMANIARTLEGHGIPAEEFVEEGQYPKFSVILVRCSDRAVRAVQGLGCVRLERVLPKK